MVCAGTQWFLQGQQQFLQGWFNFFGRDTTNFLNITHISDTQQDDKNENN